MAPAAAALALVAGGVAAVAVTTLSGDQVAAGMPLGSTVFIGTDPRCAPAGEDTFRCTLAHPPTEMTVPDYTGSKFTFVDDDQRIAGGCIGADAAGLQWDCYLGELAVEKEIMVREMLGMHQSGPASG